ncbi:Rhs protein, partial [Streptomyces sp. 3MP-14]
IVEVCKVIVAVLGIVVMIIGGPLAWVVLAAALVVLADTLIKYAKGEAGLLDVAFAALDCIPGMKGLTTLGGLARGLKGLASTGLRGLRQGALRLGRRTRGDGIPMNGRNACGDPVDVATGELLMSATDVELPGVLPLVVERHHISSYRAGRWFGSSWASTLDQRLVLDEHGARLFTADGMTLLYPRPIPGEPVFPVEGPRWSLSWDGQPLAPMSVHQPASGQTSHFAPVEGRPGSELPLIAITDRNNNRIQLAYDNTGAPTDIHHSGGYHLGITTTDGRVTALTLLSDPDEPTLLTYAYDTAGLLAEITNSSGRPLKFSYDEHARMSRWEDRNGYWYSYAYDEQGRCVYTTGTDRALEYRYAYDEETHRTVVTDSLGHDSVYQFNDSYQLNAHTDPLGQASTREWDRYDRALTVTDPLGRTTRYTYDDQGNPVSVLRPDGREIAIAYSEFGKPTAIAQADGSRWRYEFDAAGNRTAAVDPAGAVTRFRYSDGGALVEVVDALGAATRIAVDPAGLPAAVTEASGGTTRYERDALGRLTRIVGPTGAVSTWEWTPEGRPTRHTDPNGAVRSWTWDAEGNCLSHTDAAGGVTAYEHGAFDLPVAEIRPDGTRYTFERDTESRIRRVTNAQGLTWEYLRDPAGRVLQETDFDGRTVAYAYDAAGQRVSRTNALGQVITLTRDVLGRIVEKDADGDLTRFAYDPAGRLVRAHRAGETEAEAAELLLERDALGRVVAESLAGRTVRHSYDALGRRTARTTPSGVVSLWTYSEAGTPSTLTTSGRVLSFDHDAEGRETRRGLGDALTLTQAWDPAGHLTEQRLWHGERQLQGRAYDWRADNHLLAVHDQEAGTTRYELDPLGRPLGVQTPEWEEAYAYDPEGNQTSASWTGAPVDSDACGPRSYEGTRVTSAGRVRYAYDEAGRTVERRVRTLSGQVRTWRYVWDAEDRLVGVVGPDGASWRYGYDPLGRRVSKWRVAADGSSERRVEFVWDGPTLAEQVSVDDGHGAEARPVVLTWNHFAHRPLTQARRVAGSAAAWPTRDAAGGGGTATATAATGLGKPADGASGPHGGGDGDPDTDTRFWAIITDLVGTPTHLVDEEGETAWRSTSTLWGRTVGTGVDCPLRFPGQYADDETGWHYNHYRHYDPEISRFTSPDPLGLDPAPNAYTYPRNPHSWTDPLGLTPCRAAAREQALRDAGVPDGAEPLDVRLTPATTPQGKQILDENYQPVMFHEEVHLNNRDEMVVFQDHHTGHQYGDPNGVGDQPPHVHVRPWEDQRNGQIPGCEEHYYYDPDLG